MGVPGEGKGNKTSDQSVNMGVMKRFWGVATDLNEYAGARILAAFEAVTLFMFAIGGTSLLDTGLPVQPWNSIVALACVVLLLTVVVHPSRRAHTWLLPLVILFWFGRFTAYVALALEGGIGLVQEEIPHQGRIPYQELSSFELTATAVQQLFILAASGWIHWTGIWRSRPDD